MNQQDLEIGSGPIVHVRGHSAFHQPAGSSYRYLAAAADASLAMALCAGIVYFSKGAIFPRKTWLLLWLGATVAVMLLQWLIFGRSLGEALWGLAATPGQARKIQGRQVALARAPTNGSLMSGSFLTFLGWLIALFLFHQSLSSNPAWFRAERWTLQPFIPNPSVPSSAEWSVTPFYFSLGAWPKAIFGKPVLFSTPYEKGPPDRFLGHIVARWEMPDTRLTIEGPMTPISGLTRETVRECLSEGFSFRCSRLREATLSKHLAQMRRISPSDWSMRWFTVENEAIPPDEQAQGIYVKAENPTRAEIRFILISPKGTQQTFVLDRAKTARGEESEKIFEEAIRSLRVSEDLNPGRSWVDRVLESVKLDHLESIEKDPAFVSKITDIQAALIAKISVEPKILDTYFHLGGTALLLARYAAAHQLPEWGAIEKPLVQAAYLYAQDVDPGSAKTQQLQRYWLEAQKY